MEAEHKYSCDTPAETLEWIKAILHFIRPYRFFFQTNVVNFLKDKLWEAVDKDWLDCLRNEPVENLLLIPSGVVQSHWPGSLKEFVNAARSLSFRREQVQLEKTLPGILVTSLNTVLSQGMNSKKKHEVEILSSIVSYITKTLGADTVVDIGAGQGYLTQVLAFQYQLSVVAIDSSTHHGVVTNARAERIKKHYLAKFHNYGLASETLNMPRTVTCRVLSSSMLRDLSSYFCRRGSFEEKELNAKSFDVDFLEKIKAGDMTPCCSGGSDGRSSLVLAGLHACGDLSTTMLRTFSECENVKAMVSIGCCYNLLSEDDYENGCSDPGFPMSKGVKFMNLSLGKNARDLACQSAERWKDLEKDDGIQNFDLHSFRAVFQMILDRYYPSALLMSPSIGRQGKALRRQQRKNLPNTLYFAGNEVDFKADLTSDRCNSTDGRGGYFNKYDLFEKFSYSGLSRLGLQPLPDMDLLGLWRECHPTAGLIGPYWSLRAALGPLLETLLLLDRLLFLQEQVTTSEVVLLPIFDPSLSPRNLAIIARKG